jgi:hypothetical protein
MSRSQREHERALLEAARAYGIPMEVETDAGIGRLTRITVTSAGLQPTYVLPGTIREIDLNFGFYKGDSNAK